MDLRSYLLQPEHTQTKLAERMRDYGPSVTQGAISQWLRSRIPAERVLQIEAATDRAVTRYELRPDIYPQERAG